MVQRPYLGASEHSPCQAAGYTQQALKWMLNCVLNLDCILSGNKDKILK